VAFGCAHAQNKGTSDLGIDLSGLAGEQHDAAAASLARELESAELVRAADEQRRVDLTNHRLRSVAVHAAMSSPWSGARQVYATPDRGKDRLTRL